MNFRPIHDFGAIETGLRNIRFSVDGRSATIDLIPEFIEEKPHNASNEPNPIIREIIGDGRLVVEGSRLLRLEFDYIFAIATASDSHLEFFKELHAGWSDAPRIENSRAFYPLLEVESSPWMMEITEFLGDESSQWHHFRMISAECSLDLLGSMPTGTWLPNTNPSF